MINVSKEFLDTMQTRTDFKPVAEITFSDGSVKEIGWLDFTLQNNSVADCSGTTSFPLGIAIEKTIQIEFRNDDDRFSEFDFIGARIRLWLSYELQNTTEKIAYGTFTVISPETYGETIIITAVDDMYKTDTPYASNVLYPVSLGAAVRDVCSRCGLLLQTARFKNDDFIISKEPENITNRQFLAYASMIACGYARMNYNGRLCINSYDLSAFEESDHLFGGVFDGDTPYSTGDNAFGGNFNPWNQGDNYSGGTFAGMGGYHVLYNFINLTVDTDDVVITGIQTVVDEKTYSSGEDGYILSIENPLITGKEQEAVDLIGESIIGLRFRPFTADHISYPLAEFGDLAYVVDRKQNYYQTILTDINFTFLGYTTFRCAADSPIRNSSNYGSEITKAIVTARKNTSEQLSNYDLSVRNMTSIMANSLGLFETIEETESGGKIVYQHDKPTLEESIKIWKKSEQGFMVSQDGGKTWIAGMDAYGNAVLNVLSVIGLNFDWAQGGTLTLGGKDNGNGVFRLLSDDGKVIATMDNTGFQVLLGIIAGPTFISKGRGYIGSSLDALYTKIENGRYWLGYNTNNNADIDAGIYNANIANFGNGMRFIAPLDNPSASSTEMSPKFAYFFDPDQNSNSAYSVFSVEPYRYSNELAEKGKRYARAVLRGGLIIDPYTGSGNSGDSALEDSAKFGIGWQVRPSSGSSPSYGIYPTMFGKGASNARVTGTGIEGPLECEGIKATTLSVTGAKSRIIDTEDYDTIHQYCYEMASPYFGDLGGGITDEDGECYVSIDDRFSETCSDSTYYVFLQKEFDGDLWVSRKEKNYFVVKGTPGCPFAWEIKQKQKGYENYRLDQVDRRLEEEVQPMNIYEVYNEDLLSLEEFYEQQYDQ